MLLSYIIVYVIFFLLFLLFLFSFITSYHVIPIFSYTFYDLLSYFLSQLHFLISCVPLASFLFDWCFLLLVGCEYILLCTLCLMTPLIFSSLCLVDYRYIFLYYCVFIIWTLVLFIFIL